MKYYQQLDEMDCGAACIAMIASHYGKQLNTAQIRNVAGTDYTGTNIRGVLLGAKEYGLNGEGVKSNDKQLTKEIAVPFIAHIDIEKDINHYLKHFVVVKKITTKYVEVWDPNPKNKIIKYSLNDFKKIWSGYAVFLEPDVNFKSYNKNENLLLKFLPIFLPHKKNLLFSFMASLILLVFGILVSFYYKYIFDEIIESKAINSLTAFSSGVLIIIIMQCVTAFFRGILLSHFSYKTDLQLNFSYFAHILKLPISFFESRKAGEVLSRLGDLGKIKSVISFASLSGCMDMIMLLISGPFLFYINSSMFGIALITVIIVSFISIIFASIYRSHYSDLMNKGAEVQSYLFESINGMSTIKALNVEDIIENKYEEKKMSVLTTSWKLNKYGLSQSLITGIINGISNLLIYWIGSYLIIQGKMSLGTLITFNSLLVYFSGPLFRLVGIQNSLQEAFIAARRVGEILELEKEDDSNTKYIIPEKMNGNIDFQNVTFSYGTRRPVYEDFNLTIQGKTCVGFVGESGCGKSTLIKLILKFYKCQSGKIFIDNTDINFIDTKWLRRQIGYVPQDIFLFSGSVKENIMLNHTDATMTEVMEACKKAGAHDFIEKMPDGYDSELGEHGGGLSGGEKQRIVLARALLGNPSILILDEATSSLDSLSEAKIYETIEKLRKEGMTIIIIAHRLSTLRKCDIIYVMDKGRIIEKGNHKQLINHNGLYKKMNKGLDSK